MSAHSTRTQPSPSLSTQTLREMRDRQNPLDIVKVGDGEEQQATSAPQNSAVLVTSTFPCAAGSWGAGYLLWGASIIRKGTRIVQKGEQLITTVAQALQISDSV